jgi:hypothetical protein
MPATADQLLQQAIAAHRRGALADAASLRPSSRADK